MMTAPPDTPSTQRDDSRPDTLEGFAARIRRAVEAGAPLRIEGGGSKNFYGGPLRGEPLSTTAYAGVIAYAPTELVITARAGTALAQIEAVLAEKQQRLAFEPPRFSPDSTIGGVVAAGLSGPRRLQAGAVRDFVLGTRIVDGQGRILTFGGQVMKNVAGYDVSRVMAGSLGTLGLIAEVSLKVLPVPVAEATLRFACAQAEGIALANRWGGQPLPVSATAWHDGTLWVRLSGAEAAVTAARASLGGEVVDDEAGRAFWQTLRDQKHTFFTAIAGNGLPVWRLSVPSTTQPLDLPGDTWVEWGGALRWLASDASADQVRAVVLAAGGHATVYRASDDAKTRAGGAFQPLSPALAVLNRNLKREFDPRGIFGPGRLYPDF
ncbi:MAG: glycolate oxidase subunit GlcE [Rhodanobacter sp.]|jgi:glycolate oxidase FAD binding subunit|nr:glycolate oxidase subunit GlcE [Rhodanobacter sp.]